MLKGAELMAEAVGSTLGPGGRIVAIEQPGMPPHFTKDGWTVTTGIWLGDAMENMGAHVLREAAHRTLQDAGDGTTSATLIAQWLMKKLDEAINSTERGMFGINKERINVNTIDKLLSIYSEALEKRVLELRTEVGQNDKELEMVINISTNSDTTIAPIVHEACSYVGLNGAVSIMDARNEHTYIEKFEGFTFKDKGLRHSIQITNHKRRAFEFIGNNTESVRILIVDEGLTRIKPIAGLLEKTFHRDNPESDKPLVIVAHDFDGDALTTILSNFTNAGVPVFAVKAPEFGDNRTNLLNDLAVYTGGTVVGGNSSVMLQSAGSKHIGRCRSIFAKMDMCSFIEGNGDEDKIDARINDLKDQIKESKGEQYADAIKRRLTAITGRSATIYVGGITDAQQKEIRDRVDDAVKAGTAALESGYVTGGGATYLQLAEELVSGELSVRVPHTIKDIEAHNLMVKSCLVEALKRPFEVMVSNAGQDSGLIRSSLKSYRERFLGTSNTTPMNFTVMDVNTCEIGDARELGIIDPSKVISSAIKNAIACASTFVKVEFVMPLTEEGK